MTAHQLRAAYTVLRALAFHDMKLPTKVTLLPKRLRVAWGYHYGPPHRIEIDSGIKTGTHLLKVVAHEMCHAVLEQNAACDHHKHDATFKALAEIVCDRMGWKGEI